MSSTLPRVDIRARILTELTRVIPELEPEHFRADRSIRDQLDIDSMDLLNFVIGLSKSFALPIPEADYKRIATVDALLDYVESRLQAAAAQSPPSYGDVAMMFDDRADAARQLAIALAPWRQHRPVILAIPRGAVPMGLIIAQALAADFDLVQTRKIGAPQQPEVAIGAVAESGWSMIDPMAEQYGASQAYIAAQVEQQRALMAKRRQQIAPLLTPVEVAGRCTIVVDDGLATGTTMIAALHDTRLHAPARLICAVPVASSDAHLRVGAYADQVVCLHVTQDFYAVAQFYRNFPQLSDHEVAAMLARWAAPCH